jgi:hypothetical protein
MTKQDNMYVRTCIQARTYIPPATSLLEGITTSKHNLNFTPDCELNEVMAALFNHVNKLDSLC